MTRKWYEEPVRSFEFRASRWPWQEGYSWSGGNGLMERFGGGWKYKLGFATGGWKDGRITLNFDLLFGMISMTLRSAYGVRKEIDTREFFKRDAALRAERLKLAEKGELR